jgi:hypothetical protein
VSLSPLVVALVLAVPVVARAKTATPATPAIMEAFAAYFALICSSENNPALH